MFGPTRALLAILMVGMVACTFERAGTGAAPPPDPANDAGNRDSAGEDVSVELDGDSGKDAGTPTPDVSPSVDGSDARGETAPETHHGDSSIDVADVGAPIEASPVDAPVPTDADAADDGPAPEGSFPGACVTYPGAVAFTPPGSPTRHCYWVQATPANWFATAMGCIAGRGHLVTLTSSEETAFVVGLVPAFTATDRIWIGGTDGRFSADGPGSGPFTWVTGEPFTFTNWYADTSTHEPDGTCDSCTGSPCYCEHRIVLLNDGKWKDAYEAVPYRSVCEAE